jgi:transposase-like protein
MKEAIARACGVTTDQVDKWRKAISARRRGMTRPRPG